MSDDKYGPNRPLDVLNARGLTAKREYVRGLEQRRDAEALSLLVECLCDESWFLRDLAEEAFLRMGAEQAHHLVPLLDQGLWFTRTSAARVLGRLAYRPAVPGLFRLAEDSNATARAAAWDALMAIAAGGGAMRLAHALHRLPPDARTAWLEGIGKRDRVLRERLERFAAHPELMSLDDPDALADDSADVRTSEEGVEWEVLTGPPPPVTKPPEDHGGRGGTSSS
jgi:HEAT repeat protein